MLEREKQQPKEISEELGKVRRIGQREKEYLIS